MITPLQFHLSPDALLKGQLNMGHLVAHFCKACPFRDNVRPNIRYYIVTTIWRRNSGLYRSTTTDHSVRLTPQIGKGTQSPTEFLTSNVKKKPAKREKDTSVAKRTSTKQQKHPPSPPPTKRSTDVSEALGNVAGQQPDLWKKTNPTLPMPPTKACGS